MNGDCRDFLNHCYVILCVECGWPNVTAFRCQFAFHQNQFDIGDWINTFGSGNGAQKRCCTGNQHFERWLGRKTNSEKDLKIRFAQLFTSMQLNCGVLSRIFSNVDSSEAKMAASGVCVVRGFQFARKATVTTYGDDGWNQRTNAETAF